MKPVRMAGIGMALIVVGVAFAFVWWYSAGYIFLEWYGSHQISALLFAVLAIAPSAVLVIAGLAMYVVGRNAFWKMYQRRKGYLAIIGLALMFVGGFFIAWIYAFSVYAADKIGPPYAKPPTYYLYNNSPYIVLFILWFIAGLLVFADAIEARWKENK